jgi:sodium/bile acid cotransporter 7
MKAVLKPRTPKTLRVGSYCPSPKCGRKGGGVAGGGARSYRGEASFDPEGFALVAALQKYWFLLTLVVLIPLGLGLGMAAPSLTDGLPAALGRALDVYPRAATAVILLLMAFSLESRKIGEAVRSPGPVLWATAISYGLIPLLGWALIGVQTSADFRIGLLIACSVPCTMAAASVWTRKAGGNDAVSLMVTMLTNGACFVATPLWLEWTTGRRLELDSGEMILRLMTAVLLPCVAGQLLRLAPPLRDWATRRKVLIGVVAQALILTLVFGAAYRGGVAIADSNGTGDGSAQVGPNVGGVWGVAVVWLSAVGIHLAAMAVAWIGSRGLGFTREDAAAVVFAGSQKTLPVGVLIATDPQLMGNPDLLGPGLGVPFAVFPMLMYHASQLFIDTAIADRLRSADGNERGDEGTGR